MNFFEMMISHVDDFAILIILTLLILLSSRIIISKWKRLSDIEKERKTAIVLEALLPIALSIVIDAERRYGKQTGPLKRSWVLGQLYSLIPNELKKNVTEEDLDSILKAALAKAELLFEENAKVKELVS